MQMPLGRDVIGGRNPLSLLRYKCYLQMLIC
jgi:hypothetical protein